MITTKNLGSASGIQQQAVVDRTESDAGLISDSVVIVGKFLRGRTDKPFRVTRDNYQTMLGRDPNSPSYKIVEDVFQKGVDEVSVFRVGSSGVDEGVVEVPETPSNCAPLLWTITTPAEVTEGGYSDYVTTISGSVLEGGDYKSEVISKNSEAIFTANAKTEVGDACRMKVPSTKMSCVFGVGLSAQGQHVPIHMVNFSLDSNSEESQYGVVNPFTEEGFISDVIPTAGEYITISFAENNIVVVSSPASYGAPDIAIDFTTYVNYGYAIEGVDLTVTSIVPSELPVIEVERIACGTGVAEAAVAS